MTDLDKELWLTTIVLLPIRVVATVGMFVLSPILWPLIKMDPEVDFNYDYIIRGIWRRSL